MSGRNEKASRRVGEKAPAASTEEQPSGSIKRTHNAEASEIDAKRPKVSDENSANSGPAEQLIPKESNDRSAKGSSSVKSILALNAYCWNRIFSYLRLRDQLKLAASNRRISEVYKDYMQHRYRRIDESVTANIDGPDLASLLELMGANVISYESPLDPHDNGEQHLWLLRNHCQELQHLKMTFRRRRWSDLLSLQKLTSLHAHLHFGSPEIYIQFISNLVHLPRLRKLKLEAPDYNGNGLHVLENLESLEVGAHPGFNAECLVICCLKMKRLRHLNIGKHIENLTAENFRVIVRNCRNLERLVFGEHLIDSDVPYEMVCQLPRLKHLQLWIFDHIKPDFIEGLINKPGDQLESLTLIGSELQSEQVEHLCEISSLRELHVACDSVPLRGLLKLTKIEYLHIDMPDITNDQLMELLRGCPLLSVLSVENCRSITSDFVREATQFCKQSRPNLMKVVYLHESSVDWRRVRMLNDDRVIRFIQGSLSSPILINKELSDRN